MDIRHYFDATDFSEISDLNPSNWKYSLGAEIEKNTTAFNALHVPELDLAIIGVPFDSNTEDIYLGKAPAEIRRELYHLAKPENKLKIVDLGNLKPSNSVKGNYQALRDIVEYFNELKVRTVVIGGSQDLNYGICEAYKGNSLFTYSTIDAVLDIKKGKESFSAQNYLSRIFNSNPDLFQFSLIAYQSHYVASEYFSKTKGLNNHIRLGQLRDDISCCEPVLRNSDVCSFDMGAIKYSEAYATNSTNPNGLSSDEACQLAKYAGLSDRLKVFGLFEVNPDKDQFKLTSKLAAQIIWYYINGRGSSANLGVLKDEDIITYQVDVKNVSKPLVFRKDRTTNQWWMQLQAQGRNIDIACSENEYRQASNNDIPELWLKYIQKIDENLK